ncbi:MAG: hypothetical protein FWE11_03090 [Defluviitaleaceae bacterium]|nr:hypothetical protein [Defluviitaleaceae bacterium]
MANKEFSLIDVYANVQNIMTAKLLASRTAIPHSGEKGAASERSWVEWFRTYLPRRYKVDKAFVVDSENNRSKQIDIVIYDAQYSHLVFEHEGVHYVPAESVYAVFEVKQDLKPYLDYAGNQAESVRKLKRTSVPIPHAGGIYKAKEPHFIPAGILTTNSSWADPLGVTFEEHLLALEGDKSLQCGCVIQEGAFTCSSDGIITKSNKEQSLISFFFDLLLLLQSLATVAAIDINAYAEMIKKI